MSVQTPRVHGSESFSGDCMELTFAQQSAAFLYSIILGTVLGAIYGAFKLVRTALNLKKPVVFIMDFVFMQLCAVLIYLFVLAYLSGQTRLYLLPGLALGFLLFRLTLGALLFKIYNPLLSFIKRVSLYFLKKFKIFAKKVLKKLRRLLYNKQVSKTV